MKISNNDYSVIIPCDMPFEKEAFLGAVGTAIGRGVGKFLAGRAARTKINEQVYNAASSMRGAQNLSPTRVKRLSALRAGGRTPKRLKNPVSTMQGPGTDYISQSQKLKSLVSQKTNYSVYANAAKKNVRNKAIKYGLYGGAAAGSIAAGDFVSKKRDPYQSQDTYNRHIRDNISSGNIDPRNVGTATIRNIMQKHGTYFELEKQAYINVILNAGFAATSIPGQTTENKEMVKLKRRIPLRPQSMRGNF